MYASRIKRTISAGHFAGPEGHKCRTQHGHDFRIIVEIRYTQRQVDPDTGWGPDFGAIKKIIDQYDHQNLNDLPRFKVPNIPASTENLAREIYSDIKDTLGIAPYFVQIQEGADNTLRYTGPDRDA